MNYNMKKVTVLAYYKEQVRAIFGQMEKLGEFDESLKEITVSTVDGYQGSENDVVILSLVRGNPECHVTEFAGYPRRQVVAISRAKKSLIIVGNDQTLRSEECWDSYFKKLDQEGRTGFALRLPCHQHGLTSSGFLGQSLNWKMLENSLTERGCMCSFTKSDEAIEGKISLAELREDRDCTNGEVEAMGSIPERKGVTGIRYHEPMCGDDLV
jgi:hypothetical protein